jgi:PAS domain S-box-containing protein
MLSKLTSLLMIVICLLLSLSNQAYAKDDAIHKILVLNSYHKGFPWVDGIVEAIESGLNAEQLDYVLRVEYMDTKVTTYDDAYSRELYNLYSCKYDNYKFDAIICSDDQAFDFLREYHTELFPDTPIVFCAVNNSNATNLINHNYFTGILETPDQESMINLALKLHPETKKIYLIADTTPSGNYRWGKQTIPLMSTHTNLQFIRIDDSLSLLEIETKLSNLPDDSIAFYAALSRDNTGHNLPLRKVVPRISAASRRPIYTFLSQDLQYGLVGGNVLDGYHQGEKAFDMAARILKGENIAKIPIETKPTSQFMFNYPQLKRFNINLSDLPKESIIINKPRSFYMQHKQFVWIILGSFTFLITVVVLLVLNNVHSRISETKLLANEKKLRLLFDKSPIGICTVDLHGDFITTNQAYEQMLGYSKEELSKLSFFDVTHPDYRPANKQLFQEMFTLKSTGFKMEKIYIRKNGVEINVSVNATAVIDKTGKTSFGTAFVEDITERKEAEKKLIQSKQFIDTVLNGIAEPIFVKNEKHRWTMVNDAFCKMLKQNREDLIGKSDYDFFPEKEAKLFWEHDHLVMSSDKPDFSEEELTVEKQTSIFLTSKSPFYNPINNKKNIVGIIRDITERKQMEQALAESEHLLTEAQRLASVGCWVQDVQSTKLTWSDETFRIFEIDKEFSGDLFAEFQSAIHPEDKETVVNAYTLSLKTKEPYTVTHRLLMPDGRVKHVHEYCETQYDKNGNPVKSIGTIQDITKRKNAEEEQERLKTQLVQAQKMESVGRLAGGVAHDFNNMLSIIIGYSESTLEKIQPGDPLYEDITEILNAGKRSADITKQLLAFARQQTTAPKILDLNDSIKGILKMLRRLIGEDINLEWKPGRNIWSTKIDPSQIDQILANLCVNARDAITDIGHITIETKNISFDEEYCSSHADFMPGNYIMLAVSDNGRGVAKELIEKIFEPFFTTKSLHEGTGLGLSTVYGIVKQNNGFVNVYSEIDKGTSIKVYLPRHDGLEDEKQVDSVKKIPLSHGETILLVEDEESILKLGGKMLNSLGYKVLPAASPANAIKIVEEDLKEFDLLITDVIMPEMNGRMLSEHLQIKKPDLKTLFMSGYTANVIANRGILEEGVCFIQKPLSKKELSIKVREILDNTDKLS